MNDLEWCESDVLTALTSYYNGHEHMATATLKMFREKVRQELNASLIEDAAAPSVKRPFHHKSINPFGEVVHAVWFCLVEGGGVISEKELKKRLTNLGYKWGSAKSEISRLSGLPTPLVVSWSQNGVGKYAATEEAKALKPPNGKLTGAWLRGQGIPYREKEE